MGKTFSFRIFKNQVQPASKSLAMHMQQSSVCKMTDEPKESRVCVANQSQTGKLNTNSSLYLVSAKTENSVCTLIPIFEKLHCLSLLNDESKNYFKI